MHERILIIEDEAKIADLLSDYLRGGGFEPHCIDHGDRALAWLETHPLAPSLVILDLMLPGVDGLDLCRALRRVWPELPVIMLTARVEEIDRLLGLELGADDYICKPFSPREVIARVRAVLRRTQAPAPGAIESTGAGDEPLTLDRPGFRARLDDRDAGLTAVEFQLLAVMSDAPGRIFTREQLINHMYRDHHIDSERTVDSHIKKLRRKLADIRPGCDIIQSVYSVGYRFEPPDPATETA